MNTADVWDGLGWLFGNHEEGQFAYTDTSGSLEDPVLDSVWLGGEEGLLGEEGTTIATTELATYEEDQLVSSSETFLTLDEQQQQSPNCNNDNDDLYWQNPSPSSHTT